MTNFVSLEPDTFPSCNGGDKSPADSIKYNDNWARKIPFPNYILEALFHLFVLLNYANNHTCVCQIQNSDKPHSKWIRSLTFEIPSSKWIIRWQKLQSWMPTAIKILRTTTNQHEEENISNSPCSWCYLSFISFVHSFFAFKFEILLNYKTGGNLSSNFRFYFMLVKIKFLLTSPSRLLKVDFKTRFMHLSSLIDHLCIRA